MRRFCEKTIEEESSMQNSWMVNPMVNNDLRCPIKVICLLFIISTLNRKFFCGKNPSNIHCSIFIYYAFSYNQVSQK